MKDVVVGSITNYNWDQIKYWVNSLDQSGFDGLKIMICYNIDYDLVEELTKRNYTVFGFERNDEERRLQYSKPNFNICLERFIHIWHFLNRLENKEQYRYLITTDVKDVVFQTNPSEWLEKNIKDKKINVASESIRYKDEEWGKNNLLKSFGPLVYDTLQNNVICNAGTFSGEFQTILDLCFNIYVSCGASPSHVEGGGGPDQAALNMLLNLKPYSDITNVAASESGYAAQLGTTGPQIKSKYGVYLTEACPIFEDDLVKTSTGIPFSIVHQYDRTEWKTIIEEKYS